MDEATETFFASLPARAPAVLRSPISGSLQIDLTTDNRTEHWLVRLGPGRAEVERARGTADALWTSSADLFHRLITGHAQGISAVLRNESTFSGNVTLFLVFRHFFPDHPGAHDPRNLHRRTGRSG